MDVTAADLVRRLQASGIGAGDLVALVVVPGVGGAVVTPAGGIAIAGTDTDAVAAAVGRAETSLQPRWVVWSNEPVAALAHAGVRLARCWHLAAVHRLLVGGWRVDPAVVWAVAQGLDPSSVPAEIEPDLFTQSLDAGDEDEPVGPDGHLRASWAGGGWQATPERLTRWAGLALDVATGQQVLLEGLPDPVRATATARSESAAELLCAELAVDGLPMDRSAAEEIIAAIVGERPSTDADAAAQRARRDEEVLRHVPGGPWDLRSPAQVKSLLRRVGIEVPDTRAWRLEARRDEHPVVDALLRWRKAERTATTFGYAWLDAHLGADGRLRGMWTGSDGAAGRMTATAGLHNMPAELRAAVIAEPGHVFVRADLGQIEPRVLAAVSGDAKLARATVDDDLYLPVARQLGVDRDTAKVAVLGAMYGQTTGHGAQALRRLRASYPVAMAYLEAADHAAQAGRDLRTYGGRLVRMSPGAGDGVDERIARDRAAARGRYGRNAMVQGAAAELFKAWAATVRARAAPLGARVVLCLHDELLVHVPAEHGAAAAELVDDCLQEAVRRWAPQAAVRFVADIAVIPRWSDAT